MSCYNSSNTIERAMMSVLNNTYKNIELVVVDDCSTDNSVDIILKIQANDNRVKLVTHNENLGAGVARKDGIENSAGDYVGFCDSDDTLLENHIELLINAAVKYDADIVTSGYTVLNNDIKEERKTDRIVILEKQAKFAVLKEDVLRFLNPSIVRKSLWSKVTYSTRRYTEDSPTLIKLLWYADRRVVLPESTYVYYQNNQSLTHTASNFKEVLFNTLCAIDTYKFFREVLTDSGFFPSNVLIARLGNFLNSVPTTQERLSYYNEIQEIKQFVNKYYEEAFE